MVITFYYIDLKPVLWNCWTSLWHGLLMLLIKWWHICSHTFTPCSIFIACGCVQPHFLFIFVLHTHTQPFYCSSGICPGPPGWAGTRKAKPGRLNQSRFTGARDSEWQWHLLGCMQVCTSSQTTTPTSHHLVFYRPDALPAAQPTASKHWRT